VKLLLDEHYSPRIAEDLRAQGLDVTAVVQLSALRGLADRMLFTVARDSGRAVVTENVRDFIPIVTELARIGTSHSGLILTDSHRFPRSRDGMGRLTEALSVILVAHPQDEALRDRVIWLKPADGSEP
jgi:predicted nuclease of predicted toxin-antitoxin system